MDVVEGELVRDEVDRVAALGVGGSAVFEAGEFVNLANAFGAVVTSILAGGARPPIDLALGDIRVNVGPIDLTCQLTTELDEWPTEPPWAKAGTPPMHMVAPARTILKARRSRPTTAFRQHNAAKLNRVHRSISDGKAPRDHSCGARLTP